MLLVERRIAIVSNRSALLYPWTPNTTEGPTKANQKTFSLSFFFLHAAIGRIGSAWVGIDRRYSENLGTAKLVAMHTNSLDARREQVNMLQLCKNVLHSRT
jgi:hypothetical protein